MLQEVQVKAQKAGALSASGFVYLVTATLRRGEDDCESHAGGGTQKPGIGGGCECWQQSCSWLRVCRWGSTVGMLARCGARVVVVRDQTHAVYR